MVEAKRPSKGPGAVFAALSLALLVLVAAALRPAQPPPPPTAEYAPEAVQAIRLAPLEQAAQSGTGPDAGSGGAGSTTTTTLPGTPQKPIVGPKIDTQRVKRCIGDPPRQVEDAQSPPCVPYWEGDNGGATAPGVTADTIRIGMYNETDSDDEMLGAWLNRRFQFYGRAIKFVPFGGFGGGCESIPAKGVANAKSLEQKNLFAVLGCGDGAGNEYAFYDELAQHKIITLNNRPTFATDAHLAKYHPYEWTYLPMFDIGSRHLAKLACALKGRAASHGGPDVVLNTRKFGVFYNTFVDSPPADLQPFLSQLAACGVSIAKQDQIGVTYETEGTTQNESADTQAQVNSGVLQMQQDRVTTVLLLTHANTTKQIYPAFSAQQFQPEIMLSSYLYNDSELGLNGFPPQQLLHTFGIITWNKLLRVSDEFWNKAVHEINPAYTYPTYFNYFGWNYAYRTALMLAAGLQMAGPRLTPETFARGLQSTTYPNPDNGLFEGKVTIRPGIHSYMDDAAVVWWGSDNPNPDYNLPASFCYVRNGVRQRLDDPKSYGPDLDGLLFAPNQCQRY